MPKKKSDKPKANPWAESQFKKAKVKGDTDAWIEAANALAPPLSDLEIARTLLTGSSHRNCFRCKKPMRPHSVTLGDWKTAPELADREDPLVCNNDRCPEYGKRYGKA